MSTFGKGTRDAVVLNKRIRVLTEHVLEDSDAANEWLAEAQPRLAGRVPNDLLSSEFGAKEVESLLNRIEYGVYV